jgi:RNA polymerase sigma-70 factor (TIGR02943 family)
VLQFEQDMTVLVTTHTKEMLTWAIRRVHVRSDAEDLVQDTFLAAFEQAATFRSESHPRTWLYAILNNKIAEYHRSKRRAPLVSDFVDEPDRDLFDDNGEWKPQATPMEWQQTDRHLLDDPLFIKAFEKCLASLPTTWHTCLTAKYYSELTPSEICQELGVSTTNYWQIIHRAKLKMRSCVERSWFTTETGEKT